MKIKIPWLNKKTAVAGRVGVAVGPDGLSVAHVSPADVVDYCEVFADVSDGLAQLEALIVSRGWQAKPCSLVLHPLYYQLALADTPSVEESEIAEAVRWRLKEFVDYPLNEAAIDYFQLPEDAYRGRKSMLYAVAMRKKSLLDITRPIEESELDLDCIEISELALHNLCYALPDVRGGAAVLHLLENEGFINLVEDGNIYLSRKFDIGTASFAAGDESLKQQELLLLEVQRSLDFYESQLGKGVVSNLFYSPARGDTSALGEFLAMQLGLNVEPLDIKALVISEYEQSELAGCVTALGAALGPGRQKEVVDAAH